MCDYSLASLPNRLAVEGEPLVVHRFPTGTKGLASPSDLDAPREPRHEASPSRPGWALIREWLTAPEAKPKQVCAVCVPPGARLLLRDIPKGLKEELGVGETEEVVFTQRSEAPHEYRDGVRFANDRFVLLQTLHEGQRVDILSLAPPDSVREGEEREVQIRRR